MLRVSYQESDGCIHMTEMKISRSEMLKFNQEQLAQRFAEPALAMIQDLIKERRKTVKRNK